VLAFMAVLTLAGGAVAATAVLVISRPGSTNVGADATPTPSPTPSPNALRAADDSGIGDHGPPPAGLPVVYVAYPERPWWLMAVSWDGRVVGTVKLPEAVGPRVYSQGTISGAVRTSPDGSLIRVDDAVYDQSGRLAGTLGDRGGASIWGDDNRHLCGIRAGGATTSTGPRDTVWIGEPGAPARNVITLDAQPGGGGGYALQACSPRLDQAIVTAGVGPSRREWWLYRLADGALLHHQALDAGQTISVAASQDGSLIAINAGRAPATSTTEVRRTADGTAVVSLSGGQALAFSGDDKRLVLFHGPQDVPTYDVVTIATRAQEWHYGGPDYLAAATAEPGGQGFALAMAHRGPQLVPCQDLTGRNCPQSQSALDAVLVVRPDGAEVALGDGLIPAW
jgi:hypothetical protein